MPSAPAAADERPRADVVIGDRYGTSCVGAVADMVEAILRGFGYSVSRNKPYAGGFITEHYGNPAAGLHSIQLELNRALYMDERRCERSACFARLAADFETLADRLGGDSARRTATLSGGRSRIAFDVGAVATSLRCRRQRSALGASATSQEKGRSPCGSGPSLGRKRPRRAAVARERYRTATICTALHKAQDAVRHTAPAIFPHNLLHLRRAGLRASDQLSASPIGGISLHIISQYLSIRDGCVSKIQPMAL